MGKSDCKFFILTSAGIQFEISEHDFNNIKGRIARGQTKGWYVQRGTSHGDRYEWSIQFKDIASFWADSEINKQKNRDDVIDIDKRLPGEVGKNSNLGVDCHDWNNEETWNYVAQNVSGQLRYYKQCVHCGKKSILIKKREVEVAMADKGMTIHDVPLVE